VEQRLQLSLDALGGDAAVTGFRWVWVALAPLPWLAGGVLLLVGRAHLGTGVLVAAAALALPETLPALARALDGGWDAGNRLEALAILGQPVVLLLGLLAALAAAWSRPRDGWRLAAPGPIGLYVTVAVLAWLPTALQTLERSPPGAMRSFARTELSRLEGIEAMASVTGAVVAALLLLVAPRLRPDVGGAILLVFAVPSLADAVGDALQVRVTEFLILTPPAVLGDIGLLGLTMLAIRWLVTAPHLLEVAGAHHP
jgi:hypothetical protein